jgi:hypothetical protein
VRRARELIALTLLCVAVPARAQAAPSVSLTASLTPEHLGHGTTIGFGFKIASPAGSIPPPLTAADISYPANLGIALSGVGIATCSVKALEVIGAEGCPPDSRMGYGSATAVVPFGPELVYERASIAVVRAPTVEGHISLFFYVDAIDPVNTQQVFAGALLATSSPYGGTFDIGVPLVETLPGAPDVSVLSLRATIGPEHLTYYEEVNHRTVAYVPMGILLPKSCPHGGFPFALSLSFLDGSRSTARTAVACPKTHRRSRRAAHMPT